MCYVIKRSPDHNNKITIAHNNKSEDTSVLDKQEK